MAKHIDYYVALMSPWTFLGSARIEALAAKYGASITIWPVDFGVIFPASGGLPLPKRSPQRQTYRLMELERWRDHLGIAINLQPKFFPGNEMPAVRCVIALREQGRGVEAIALAHAVLRGVWMEERDVADVDSLSAIIAGIGLDPSAVIAASQAVEIQSRREADTEQALDKGVFGAPSYVIDGEIFWGQDRLDFVERKLAAG